MDTTRSYVTARTEFTNDTKSLPPQQMAQPQPAPLPAFYRICGCFECYSPGREYLEYDYTYDDVNGKKPPQNYPRIRERGEYYIDSYNSEPWSCSFGTAETVRNATKDKSFFKPKITCSDDVSLNDRQSKSYLIQSVCVTCTSRLFFFLWHRMGCGSTALIRLDPSCLPWFGCYCCTRR